MHNSENNSDSSEFNPIPVKNSLNLNKMDTLPTISSGRKWVRICFFLYWIALTFLLLVTNPFSYLPVEEQSLHNFSAISLDPHILTFLFLAVLCGVCHWNHAWRIWVILFFYAGLTEILQAYTGREPDMIDVAHNFLGLTLGASGCWIVTRIHR